MDELKAVGAWLIEGLLAGLGTLLWWLWRTDRKEQNDRVSRLEDKVGTLEVNHIPRPDVDRIAERLERDFKHEHAGIINVINEKHRELRMDIARLSDAILKFAERRSDNRDQ